MKKWTYQFWKWFCFGGEASLFSRLLPNFRLWIWRPLGSVSTQVCLFVFRFTFSHIWGNRQLTAFLKRRNTGWLAGPSLQTSPLVRRRGFNSRQEDFEVVDRKTKPQRLKKSEQHVSWKCGFPGTLKTNSVRKISFIFQTPFDNSHLYFSAGEKFLTTFFIISLLIFIYFRVKKTHQ